MNPEKYSQHMLGVMRIVCGLTYLYCSIPTLLQPPLGTDHPAFTLYWASRWVQIFAGALILVGLFTRVAAFILSVNFLVMFPYWYQSGFYWPTTEATGFMLASVVCMYLVTAGAGRWSLDALRAELASHLQPR
ncbi:DoxX family protein [Mesorhizobium sp. UC74_2]|uniref:DoxX family protein n=1 Tax=Mesorhizobium sp. UC74_2 TaxID=3350171 RepID=UPI003672120C